MVNKIKGGRADGLTPEDLARKHHQFVGTIENEIEIGIKIEMEHTNDPEIAREIAMDHIAEYWDYYSSNNGLLNMEKELKTESIRNKFKRLIKEYTELSITDETPEDITYNINVDGHNGGFMVIRIINLNGSETFEIKKITLNDKFKSIKVIKDAINSLWNTNDKINKMVVSPDDDVINMNFSGAFWEKIYFNRLNDDYLIRLRGH